MIETSLLLFFTALCTAPGLVSRRSEKGRALLLKAMLPQGVVGCVLVLAGLTVAAVAVGLAAAAVELTAFFWLTRLGAGMLVAAAGTVMGFGLAVRLAAPGASAEVRERMASKYRSLTGWTPVIGLFCLAAAVWCLFLGFSAALPAAG